MAGWPKGEPVNLLDSAAFAAAMAWVYWQALDPLGRLLRLKPKSSISSRRKWSSGRDG